MAGDQVGRILVVEDEWLIAELLAAALEEAGYTVVGPAGWLDEAQELLGKERIDAALIDINLHGGRSFGLAAKLVEASIPFAFLSGYSDVELPPEFIGAPLLQKPVDAATVRRCVDALVAIPSH